MLRVEVERFFPHPVDRVFRRYADHAGWTAWAGLGRVYPTREGYPDRDGVGAVRAFALVPGLREEVVRFDPPQDGDSPARMDYRVLDGPVPIRDHHGEVTFLPEGGGTRIAWRITFRSAIPGLGWVLEHGLSLIFQRILGGLGRDLDGGSGA
jgi:uncharacterized protein YndB with AHSA1/START domain